MLWDHILTMPPLFSIYIALGIVAELRNEILISDFSSAMLLFSDLSNINLEKSIERAIVYIKITPKSILEFTHDVSENRYFVPTVTEFDFKGLLPIAQVIDLRSLKMFRLKHILNSINVDFEKNDKVERNPNMKYTVLIAVKVTDEQQLVFATRPRLCKVPISILDSVDQSELCNCECNNGNDSIWRCQGSKLI